MLENKDSLISVVVKFGVLFCHDPSQNPFFGFGPGGFPGFGGPLGPPLHHEVSFVDTFRCYSMVFFSNASSKAEADYGGKSEWLYLFGWVYFQ